MLHPVRVPPSAAGSLPPSDVPSGNTLGSITDAVTSTLRTCSSRASRMLCSLSLASSGHLTPHGQPGGGIRPPGSAPLHRLPARRPPPTAKKLRAPACGIMFRASHHASGPQELPSRRSGNKWGQVLHFDI